MNWQPLSESELVDVINEAKKRMTIQQERLWDAMRVPFTKWKQSPSGDAVGGVWAVAVLGKEVLWYNEIEEDFNWSPFDSWGEIGEYWCQFDELEWAVQNALYRITDGYTNRG